MSRYDKYEPFAGGFRAPIAADFGYTAGKPDFKHANLNKMYCVGVDATGKVILTAAAADVLGVMILTRPKAAGDIVDVMTDGEIVDFTLQPGTAAAAGTRYYASGAAGDYAAVAPTVGVNGTRLGTTIEASRLVVRVAPVQGV